ncbi:hypothetical protein BJY01DRAFT_255003 [Aspergillus pseudoustus]|uniref:Uncharacterized protein n=1 Tax=Aspergillus pseudoustus TaxID=1810923 RepID=A0ABR4INN6_9EURO
MSKILHKFMDAMTGSNSKSKRPSRGSDSYDYVHRSGPGSNFKSNHRTSDYGSRFESCGERPRPGTYGSGSYGPNRSVSYDSTGRPQREDYGYRGEAAYARPDHARTFSSGTDGYGPEAGAHRGQGIVDIGENFNYSRSRPGFYGTESYSHGSGEQLAANGAQRARW